jgi:acetolactate synthase I/II/III large subunit
MAEAVGQLTGRPAAVLGTRAVGGGNMAIGIHTARQNSTPMVALLGQVERRFRGREAFQEAELATSFGSLAKWAAEIDDPARASALVGEGLRVMASGRPGPVLFSLPEDVLDREVGGDVPDVRPTPPAEPDPAKVHAIVNLLANARRPLILAGGGVIRAQASIGLVALAEQLAVPVMAAWRRPDAFPNHHPLYLGITGYGAASTVLPRIEEADAMLVLGCRLNEIASFEYRVPPPTSSWAHVDVEPRTAHAGLTAPDIALVADAGDFVRAALDATAGQPIPERPANADDRNTYVAACVVDDGQLWAGPGVHPGHVIATLNRVLPDDAILTTDAGNFGLWLARGYRLPAAGDFIGPTSGAMGYGLPSAIAASLCEPDRVVVGICGDGGFAMTMNELETAVREGARPIVIVFDNRQYGTIAMHQERRGSELIATDLGPIDFAMVARASGAVGLHVERDEDFETALRQALAGGRPAVLHLELDQRWVSPDMIGRSIAMAP